MKNELITNNENKYLNMRKSFLMMIYRAKITKYKKRAKT